MSDRVLISTHDLSRAGSLRDAFREQGYEVELVTPDESVTGSDDAVLMVLSDRAEDAGSDSLVRQAREELEIPVLGYVSEDAEPVSMERATRVAEFFPPDADPDDVALVGRRLVQRRRLQEITGIVGETDAMREVLERVVQIAPVDSTVLVTGESGTGKELVARGVHGLSPRRHESFIAVNVAALSDTLLESELFGHEKGAFTGAVDSRRGLFELAHHGTVFLDEIGEMPLSTQTKLLRVLEEREFHRVGGEKPIKVDVRIIAATNQNLRQLVTIGDFRKDLYYRLNVLHIDLPPLRERSEDIPRLVRAFVDEISERYDRDFQGISPEAMEVLEGHRWPGNVRELRNLVESMVVMDPDREILPADIPPEVRGEAAGTALVPAAIPRAPDRKGEEGGLRPQLEFIFRTLVDLRVDMDELRNEFEAYRRELAERGRGEVGRGEVGRGAVRFERDEPLEIVDVEPVRSEIGVPSGPPRRREPGVAGEGGEESTLREPEEAAAERPGGGAPEEEEGEGRVVFEPGMTMEDMERAAILAALDEVDGNRRRAAELLGVGERTLYRKLRKYEEEEYGKEGAAGEGVAEEAGPAEEEDTEEGRRLS